MREGKGKGRKGKGRKGGKEKGRAEIYRRHHYGRKQSVSPCPRPPASPSACATGVFDVDRLATLVVEASSYPLSRARFVDRFDERLPPLNVNVFSAR